MNGTQLLVFLFSALGACNGFLLSGYFLVGKRERRLSDLFLGGLLLMLSVRIIKSAFLSFHHDLLQLFIQLGLSACLLIGPFLYLYVRSMVRPAPWLRQRWWLALLPFVFIIGFMAYRSPYYSGENTWGHYVEWIYKVWLLGVLLAGYELRHLLKQLWQDRKALQPQEIWLLNIYFGVSLVYLAYDTSQYTAYIVGALSFSFVIYVSILLWVFWRKRQPIAKDTPVKYANSNLTPQAAQSILTELEARMHNDKLYLDTELTLQKLAAHLVVNSKQLSQAINELDGQNYSQYIANLRVAEAQRLLLDPEYQHYKIAAIAYESGFNSLSSFNAIFKKTTGLTPNAFRKTGGSIPES